MKRQKARSPDQAVFLEQIPNIGLSIANDLRQLGITKPSQLRGKKPLDLYRRMNRLTGTRQDPCLLDCFLAAVDFMEGKANKPWWAYSVKRKQLKDLG